MRKRQNGKSHRLIAWTVALLLLFSFYSDVIASEEHDSFKLDSIALGLDSELFTEARITLPGKTDASKQKAIEEAKRWYAEARYLGAEAVNADALSASAWFLYHDRFNLGYEPVWIVYLFRQDEIACKALLGFDADLIDIVGANQEFHSFNRHDERFGLSFYEVDFWPLSVEDKAAFYRQWKPIVEEYLKKNPYYAARNDGFFLATRREYGIPAEGNVTQKEATEIALNTIVTLGADPNSLSEREIEYVFDVTDPMQPEWRLFINFAMQSSASIKEAKGTDFVRFLSPFRVVLNGQTGEVIKAFIITRDMNVSDHRY